MAKKESKGKKALKTTGRALKKAASSVLGAGSQILGAGSKALANPKGPIPTPKNADEYNVLYEVYDDLRTIPHKTTAETSLFKKVKTAMDRYDKGLKKASKPEPEIIWQVDNYNKTPKSAAEEFARTYWQEQRKIRGLKPDGTFKVVGGVRTYRVRKDGRLFVIEVVAQNPKRNKTIIKAGRIDHLDVSKVHNPRKRKRNASGTSTKSRKKTSAKKRVSSSRKAGSHKRMAPARKGATRNPRAWFNAKPLKGRSYSWLENELQRADDAAAFHNHEYFDAGDRGDDAAMKKHWGAVQRIDKYIQRIHDAMAKAKATRNPTRKGMRKLYREAKRISKTTRGRYFSSELGQRQAARHEKRHARKSKHNPSAESIRKKFAGSITGSRDLYFPQGTPSGKLAKLGRLVLIETEKGTIKPVAGTAWLCADERERLHIGSTSPNPLFNGPARSFGKVKKVEYESSKPHLGYRGPIIWFHHMGEKGGVKPTLHADGKGGLVFKGGNYRLTERGIEH